MSKKLTLTFKNQQFQKDAARAVTDVFHGQRNQAMVEFTHDMGKVEGAIQNVILVNCNQSAFGFPSLIEDDPILDFVLSRGESYPFAEERRLFYVAMTRAKKRMYVLYDKQRPSPFISEFMLRLEVGSYICPKCLEGRIEPFKDGVSSVGHRYRSFRCSNREAYCDFFETKYGDLTPPGILVTKEMTAQDVERMREKRRRAKRI